MGISPDFNKMLNVAIEEAREGLAEGGVPIGAALVDADGNLLGAVQTGVVKTVSRRRPLARQPS